MTTLNLVVGASGDDGSAWGPNGAAYNTFGGTASASCLCGTVATGGGLSQGYFARFTGVSGLDGATIDASTLSLWARVAESGTPLTQIQAADALAPTAPTDVTEYNALARTTAAVAWDNPDLSTSAYTASPSIVSVIQELADLGDPSAIVIIHEDTRDTNTTNRIVASSYDESSSEAPKLDIDYTAGGGGGGGSRLLLVGVG